MDNLEKYRSEKMEQAEIERFENVQIKDREEAEQLFAEIIVHRNALMNELISNDNAKERQIIHDVLYELKTVKNQIGSQLTRIGRANIASRRFER